MPLSYQLYTGDGANRNFAVTFSYIKKDYVAVLVNGVSVAFSWVNDSLVQTVVAPTSGTTVEVRRTTAKNPLVAFADGSTLTASNLDLATHQTLDIAVEAAERAERFTDSAASLFKANNLADLPSKPDARLNLGFDPAAPSDPGKALIISPTAAAQRALLGLSDPTSAGNAMLSAADAAAQRVLLGLASGAPSAIGKSMLTAADAAAERALIGLSNPSTIGNSMLSAADAAAERTLLGLTALATATVGANLTLTGGILAATSASPGRNVIDVSKAPYSLDKTGATDVSSGLQTAVNDAQANNSALRIPAGTYLVNSAVTVTGPIEIFGDGARLTTMRKTNKTRVSIFNVDHGSNVYIHDIGGEYTLAWDEVSTAGYRHNFVCIHNGSRDVLVERCYIWGYFYRMINILNSQNITVQDCVGVRIGNAFLRAICDLKPATTDMGATDQPSGMLLFNILVDRCIAHGSTAEWETTRGDGHYAFSCQAVLSANGDSYQRVTFRHCVARKINLKGFGCTGPGSDVSFEYCLASQIDDGSGTTGVGFVNEKDANGQITQRVRVTGCSAYFCAQGLYLLGAALFQVTDFHATGCNTGLLIAGASNNGNLKGVTTENGVYGVKLTGGNSHLVFDGILSVGNTWGFHHDGLTDYSLFDNALIRANGTNQLNYGSPAVNTKWGQFLLV